MVEFNASGECMILALEGPDAVEQWRVVIGPSGWELRFSAPGVGLRTRCKRRVGQPTDLWTGLERTGSGMQCMAVTRNQQPLGSLSIVFPSCFERKSIIYIPIIIVNKINDPSNK